MSTDPTFHAGVPRRLFGTDTRATWTHPSPTGDRFVEVAPAGPVDPASITVHVNVPRP